MNKVFVVAAKRSAIGSYLGTLSQLSPADFGSQVLKQTLELNNIKPEWVDEGVESWAWNEVYLLFKNENGIRGQI